MQGGLVLGSNGSGFREFWVQNWVPWIWNPWEAYMVCSRWISTSIGKDFKVGNYVQFQVRMHHEYVEMHVINDVNYGMSCLLWFRLYYVKLWKFLCCML